VWNYLEEKKENVAATIDVSIINQHNSQNTILKRKTEIFITGEPVEFNFVRVGQLFDGFLSGTTIKFEIKLSEVRQSGQLQI